MLWVIVGVSLAAVSLAAIGYFAWGVFRAVKDLSKEVGKASRVLGDAAAPMQAGMSGVQAAGNGARPGSAPADR